MSYTATHDRLRRAAQRLRPAQRMWVALTIFLSVIGWAYAIGSANDTTNLWLVEAARRAGPDAFTVALQERLERGLALATTLREELTASYVLDGHRVPSGWLWRTLSGR